MRFFDNATLQSFATAPDGSRLFYSFGPWSRPYVIPDDVTERRLATRQRWMVGVLVGLIVVCQVLVRIVDESAIRTWWGFLGYLGLVWLGYYLVQSVVLRSELRGLARAESRLPVRDYYASVAARHSVTYLIATLLLALMFVGLGAWMLLSRENPLLGCVLIAFFLFTDAMTGYALILKLRQQTP